MAERLTKFRAMLDTYLGTDTTVLGNTLTAWVVAILFGSLVFFALQTLKAILKRRVKLFAYSRIPHADQLAAGLISKTKNYFLFFLALLAGTQLLLLPENVRHLLQSGTILVGLLQVLAWGNFLIEFWITDYADREAGVDAARATTVKFGGMMLRLVFWVLLLLLALDNLGVNVTALVAGLGIGGIAIGLAAQNILGDLFASVSIVLDKPFVIGDFVVVGSDLGTIERIGIKTTRVRSLTGEQLIVPNSDLVSSRVRNYKRMNERRIVFSFRVTYRTTAEQLRSIPDMVRGIAEGIPTIRLDRVHFSRFGDSSLDYEVVYYVLSPEYGVYMDAQQEFNLKLFERFAREGIDFAHPTRTLFIEKGGVPEDKPPRMLPADVTPV